MNLTFAARNYNSPKIKLMNAMTYEPPKVEILLVEVEPGFNVSANINDWKEGDSIDGDVYG